ncbi:unnamed protein product [Oncorhynchus mykiss]|uniref:KIAA0319-like C-terminal domain-containing protein n=1 Tax=Oncorhynchus mykiss TaxID=8022 RepID=A0A061A6X5_ONCMY|nr:unnamed protein product [Oncorhynchus mykiss]
MLVALAQVSVSQKDTVLRQLAALLHVLDNDIHLRCLWGHSDLRYCPMQQTHTKHTWLCFYTLYYGSVCVSVCLCLLPWCMLILFVYWCSSHTPHSVLAPLLGPWDV